MYRVADIKGGLRGRGYCQGFIVSCLADTKGSLMGVGGNVKGKLYRVAETKGGLRGMGFVKGILYRVADTKGGLRGEGNLLRL